MAEVVRTYLELRSPGELRAAAVPDPSVQFVRRASIPAIEYRRLYRDVGAPYYWNDRDVWSDEQLEAYLSKPKIGVWECIVGNQSAGYFELERHADDSVEIAYFGLVPAFTARGIGKAMLTRAVQEAWTWQGPANRVWLHTCTLDSPRALPNYLARGFVPVRRESYFALLPDEP